MIIGYIGDFFNYYVLLLCYNIVHRDSIKWSIASDSISKNYILRLRLVLTSFFIIIWLL